MLSPRFENLFRSITVCEDLLAILSRNCVDDKIQFDS